MSITPLRDCDRALNVLVSGNPTLASSLGYEWTLWQTGVADFLTVNKAIESAMTPLLLGYAAIAAMAIVLWVRRRRNA